MSDGVEQEKILNYNGTVLTFHLSKATFEEGGVDKTATLHFRRMLFNPAAGVFLQKSTGFFNIPAIYEGAEIISLSCTADYRTGMNLPCILLGKSKKHKETKYLLLLLHASDEFECYVNFKLNYKMNDVHLVAGPMVLWMHNDQLFYLSPKTHIIVSVPVKISSIKWVNEIEDEGIVVLGVKHAHFPDGEDEKTFPTSDSVIWRSEFVAYSVEKQKVMNATCFLPHAYSSVVTCMDITHVCRPEMVNGQFSTSVVVATSNKQLVLFQDGVPVNVFQLPCAEPCRLHTASTSRGDLLLVVAFAYNNVCAVWKETWQVASSWQNVKSFLVDDFIGTGTEQVLLLFKDASSSSDCLNMFQITDFGEINYTSDASECTKHVLAEDDVQENRFLTIQALEARLQAGISSLQELQQHLKLKERVLSESCKALLDLVHGKEHTLPSAEEENLVSLWDEEENTTCSLDKGTLLAIEDPEHLVEKVWQRVMDTSLVVGVKINDKISLSFDDISLSLLIEQTFNKIGPIKCYSNVLKLPRLSSASPVSECEMEPLPKRLKPGCHSKKDTQNQFSEKEPSEIHTNWGQTVTAVTDLMPLLTFHKTSCIMLLHARKRINQEDDYSEESKLLTFPCGRISVGLEDISKDKYVVHFLLDNHHHKGIVEDFFAILAAFYKYSFQIFSPECTLAPVNLWLQEEMQCKPVMECAEYLYCSRPGSLYGTVFSWNQKTPCEGTLTLFCRNQIILFQCLHKLIDILPSTCVPKLLSLESKDSLIENLALSLEKEILTFRSFVSSTVSEIEKMSTWMCRSDNNMSHVTAPSSTSKEVVQQYRNEFQNEQKQSTLGMNLTINGSLYRNILWKIAHIQVNSDKIVWRLSNS
ncbi:Fanconi anemia group B protein isoform X2 [Microcaecilia unicolor]|nr:Fanconi anemia group B protein isoform X2 [Microcaecilia unicolor]XP_030057428.1 Fanconi anemia group B protein isoform X2 [Microcaecilia unicolor]XP_030057429.1 Fanconi anemia group B protein isoform X2 [Microcaecilia unicolor]